MSDHTKPMGGWLDDLTRGKDAVSIVSSLLSVDGSKNSTERLTNVSAALENVDSKTESKAIQLLSNHVKACKDNPACAASLQELLDFFLGK